MLKEAQRTARLKADANTVHLQELPIRIRTVYHCGQVTKLRDNKLITS